MKFSLALPRRAQSIPVMRRVLGDALRGLGVSDDCVADILVATSEACTNAVRHAGASADYEVVGSVDQHRCILKVADRGNGFPKAHERRTLGRRGHRELSESGRGIKIMRALVDDVAFDSEPGMGTVVYLLKRLTWTDEAPLRRLEHELVHSAG